MPTYDSYRIQEDGISRRLLEDGSGYRILETAVIVGTTPEAQPTVRRAPARNPRLEREILLREDEDTMIILVAAIA